MAMVKTLLTNGTVYDRGILQSEDILIVDDHIEAIGRHLTSFITADQIIDLTGCLVTPGLIDGHVHYREPGQTDKETIRTGTRAAAHGGFTTVGAMPNTTPVPDTPERLDDMRRRNAKDGLVHVKQFATLTHGLDNPELVDFAALKAHGAFAFSNDGSGVQSAGTMYAAMAAIQALDLPLAAHVQDNSLSQGGVMTCGEHQRALNLPGQYPESETSQLARDLVLAEATGVHYHVCHVSTKTSLDLIRSAKARGVHVTCEVTPHHLLLNEEAITTDNPFLKMNPPLRSKVDQEAMLQGLIDGTIDCIATDHAPHTTKEKSGSMQEAAFGIIGSDFAFGLLYTHLVQTGKLPLTTLIEKMTAGAADAFQLAGSGRIQVGAPADIACFDLGRQWLITKDTLASKATNTPYLGERVNGVTVRTLVSGQTVYSEAAGFHTPE